MIHIIIVWRLFWNDISFFLETEKVVGDVMVESRGGKEDMRLKKSFSRIYENGTHYVEAEKLKNILTSKELKVKPKTFNIACLQLADLLAYPSRRFMFRQFHINEENSITFSDKIIKVIKDKFYSDKNGKIEGYGIKLLP